MTWHTARDYARTIAEHFAGLDPNRYMSKSTRSGRAGKVFIDYLRNGRGNTAIGAFSPRARPGFPVAARVTWRDGAQKLGGPLRPPRVLRPSIHSSA